MTLQSQNNQSITIKIHPSKLPSLLYSALFLLTLLHFGCFIFIFISLLGFENLNFKVLENPFFFVRLPSPNNKNVIFL